MVLGAVGDGHTWAAAPSAGLFRVVDVIHAVCSLSLFVRAPGCVSAQLDRGFRHGDGDAGAATCTAANGVQVFAARGVRAVGDAAPACRHAAFPVLHVCELSRPVMLQSCW